MNPQPITITISTIDTLVTTMMLFTVADSCMPRMSSADSTSRMTIAGMLTMPVAVTAPLASVRCSSGEWHHSYGTCMPTYSSTLLKYSLQAMATVAAPTAYSRHRSQPMIHATSSPIVAYE